MFWRTEAAFQTSSLATMLDKPDVTLTEIMDDEYILQEIKCGNKRLTDFLVKEENLVTLTKLCVTEPDNSENEQKKYKYNHLASEILSAGSEIVTDALAKCTECYNVLAGFVRSGPDGKRKELNPLLASFFNKVFTLLVMKHPDQVLTYMQSEPSFLDNLIANLDVSALAESLFRLACGGEDDKHARAVKMWLAERSFVSKLIGQLDPAISEEAHQNVTFLLCELIRALRRDQFARDDNPLMEDYVDPLVAAFESRSVLDDLLDRTLALKDSSKYSDSVTSCGCSMFITLLQTLLNARNPLYFVDELGKYDAEQKSAAKDDDFARIASSNRPAGIMWEPDIPRNTEQCLVFGLPHIKKLLEISRQEPMLLPMGQVDAPLGSARLSLTQLLAQMLSNGHPKVHEEVAKLDLFRDLLDLFFKHKWNNFLHTNVINCFICALYGRLDGEGKDGSSGGSDDFGTGEVDDFGDHSTPKQASHASPLLRPLLETHHILKIIVEQYKGITEIGMKNGAVIPPYSGHVMRLAVCTYYAMREGPNAAVMKDIFEKLPQEERQGWNDFVDSHLLTYIKQNEPDQVGVIPSRDDGGLLTDHTEDFSGASTLVRPLKNLGGLGETRKSGSTSDDVFTSKPNVTAADFLKDEAMDESAFEAECNKHISGTDEWDEIEITFQRPNTGNVPDTLEPKKNDSGTATAKKRTSSSDEEDEKMDVDKDTEPPEWFSATAAPVKTTAASENWASFEDEWPSSNSTPDPGQKQSTADLDDDDWASFDQAKQQTNASAAAAGVPEDPWDAGQGSKSKDQSKQWSAFSQSDTGITKGQ